ncbi:DUF6328 family protein [Nocardioides daphniae]|uniref:Sodium:proton antiporter n=1 Tax=Nocardioides daphniae TaxID=402297 RepID=A0A4P7UDT3_9ACTN|nr:DUF6328 family protein [Nocardioides daphniae]QCC77535.1 sodium:proton antiporter [Nocardioides daphniae]GGD31008.1 hypothetical protein GCM10007231_33170 [Nocardioides daphniae]
MVEDGRDESAAERADRNWNELLQEFRVLQTGVQLLSGFLLTLPFTPRFDDLDEPQLALYLVLVVLAAATTAVLLGAVALHRRFFREQRKEALVTVGHRMAQVALTLGATLAVGATVFVLDVVLTHVIALATGAGMVTVGAVTWFFLHRTVDAADRTR